MSTLPSKLWGGDFKGLNWTTRPPSWERAEAFQIMRNDWHFNCVRRHFAGKPVYENNSTYMARLTNAATWAANNGMWIIFDLFSYDTGADYSIRVQQRSNWNRTHNVWGDTRWNRIWERLGQTFKSYPNVILELGNEPNTDGNATTFYNAAVTRWSNTATRLRNLGFNNWIGIPGAGAGTTIAPWVSRLDKLSDPKLMFFIHSYWYHHLKDSRTSTSACRSWLEKRGTDDMKNRGKRVIIGEYGVHGSPSNQDSRDRKWFQSMCTVAKHEGYDAIMQSFQPGTDFPGVQKADGSVESIRNKNWIRSPGTFQMNYFKNTRPTLYYYGGALPDPEPTPTAENKYHATTSLPITLYAGNQWRAEVLLTNIPEDIVSRITSATLTYSMWDVERTDEVKFFFNNTDQGFIAVSGNETSKTYMKSISPGLLIAGQNAILFDASAKQWGSRIEAPFYLNIQYDNAPQPVAPDTDYGYRKLGATGTLFILDRIILTDTGSQVPAAQSEYTMKKLATNIAGKDIYIEYKILEDD